VRDLALNASTLEIVGYGLIRLATQLSICCHGRNVHMSLVALRGDLIPNWSLVWALIVEHERYCEMNLWIGSQRTDIRGKRQTRLETNISH
jgi:hypothetical protein